jgi:lactate dehydrogenase-like 2-hydroxyacid dehydrogenase
MPSPCIEIDVAMQTDSSAAVLVACIGRAGGALRTGRLAGAALDVVENQPQVPPELLALDNVLLTPHLGTATHETRGTMSGIVLQSLIDQFSGRTPQHRVP